MIMILYCFRLQFTEKRLRNLGINFSTGLQKYDELSRLSNTFCGELLLTHTGENLLKSNCVSLMKVQQSGNGKLCFRYAAVTLSAPSL